MRNDKNTVVYKIESYGSVVVPGRSREEVMRTFLQLDPKKLAQDAPVAKARVVGSPQFQENTLKKFFE